MAAADTAAESTRIATRGDDDDAWWTSSRETQASTASAATGGAAQADSEGSLYLQQQLNALDAAAAFDQQPAGSSAQLNQGGTQPQLQQASLGSLDSSGGGADASGYAQPGGTSTRDASMVQPLHTTTHVRPQAVTG